MCAVLGQTSIRPYWRCYYANTDAIIYVVDSADRERMAISKQELVSMLDVCTVLSVHGWSLFVYTLSAHSLIHGGAGRRAEECNAVGVREQAGRCSVVCSRIATDIYM